MSKAADLANLIGNINAGGGGVNRNVIINGSMNVAQRGTSFTTVAHAASTLDQFRYGKSNDGEVTITQDSSGPDGFANSLKVDVTTADTSIGATQYAYIFNRIEAQNLQHLKFGTSDAQNITLSFYVKSNKTGTYSVNIAQNDNSYKQANLTYTIDSANTWERKSLTFTGDTAGIIDDNADRGFEILWWLAVGSTYTSGSSSSTFSSYSDANHAAGHAVNLLDSTSNEWFITGVQLEVGQNATEFEHEPFERTLAKCQRYYKRYDIGSDTAYSRLVVSTYSDTTSRFYVTMQLPVELRTTPTMAQSSLTLNGTAVTSIGNIGGTQAMSFTFNHGGSIATGNQYQIYGSSGTGTLEFIAEL